MHTLWKICNKAIVTDPTAPQAHGYCTLRNIAVRKIQTLRWGNVFITEIITNLLSMLPQYSCATHHNNRIHRFSIRDWWISNLCSEILDMPTVTIIEGLNVILVQRKRFVPTCPLPHV